MLIDVERDLLLNTLPGMAYRCSVEPPWTAQYISTGVRFLCSYDVNDFTNGSITWGRLVHPEDVSRLESEVVDAIAARRQFNVTYRIVDPVLGERWVLERGEGVYDCQGKATSLVGFILDITDQKLAEQRLQESEEHYRSAVELSPQIPWTANPRGKILEVGPRWHDLLGADQSASLANDWAEALHPDDRRPAMDAWEHSLSTGAPYDQRYQILLENGSYRWVRARAAGRRNSEGEIVRWYGTLEDIHAQVEAELELHQAERRYALAAAATGDIVWDWDIDKGTIRRVGPQPCTLGHSGPAFESSLSWWEELVHPADRAKVMKGVAAIIAGRGDRWSGEYRLKRADGSYAYIFDRGYVIRSGGEHTRRMVGAMQDISQRKAAEEQLQQLQTELIHVSQVSAMGAMASTLSHELNQPLTAAANYLTGMKRVLAKLDGEGKELVDQGVAEAEQQIHRAGEIIRRMRRLLRQQTGHREVISLQELALTVEKLVEASQVCPHLVLRTEIAAPADLILADQIQVEQVLLNLTRNACQAMGGADDAQIVISAWDSGDGFAVIRVRDWGRGLTEEALKSLFTAYGDSTSGGLGVGLSICRTIVEGHGGSIWAENNSDGGASFYFTIPLAEEAESWAARLG